jgi:hypothetical protein
MAGELDVLLGRWVVESRWFTGPAGRAEFERLEGGVFYLQRSYAPDPVPNSVWLIGRDQDAGHWTALYHDSRDVCRVYQMSFADRVWRVWRDAPGFAQRFTGTISADGGTISGAWELSRDGVTWERDFDLTYTKTP